MKIFGLDIGGTALKWGVSEEGVLLDSGSCPSYASLGAKRLLCAVTELLDGHTFDALGVSTAGMVSPDGSIRYANENIPGYTGVALSEILGQRYSVPVRVLNDIAAAAYSERESYGDYYYLALGTGVAGIHVREGEVMTGSSGIAGQIGYLPLGDSTVDLTASTRGLNSLSELDSRELFRLAGEGDTRAEKILGIWCDRVASVLRDIIGYVNPSCIVIGGSIAEQGEALTKRLHSALSRILPEPYLDSFTLTTASGGSLAGVLGIINYVKDSLQ